MAAPMSAPPIHEPGASPSSGTARNPATAPIPAYLTARSVMWRSHRNRRTRRRSPACVGSPGQAVHWP
jgi:hypothetical protein